MNLLPKAKGEFSEKSYWENFFQKRGSKSFDWYGEYPELCGLLHKYIKPKDNILVIGCGNSTLSASLYDVGYRNITSIDTSTVVIRQMQDLHRETRPELKFEQQDALNTGYPDGNFSCVLDKGTLDALMPDNEENTVQNINKLFKEVDRVLRVGGRYICISLLQSHILQHLLSRFPVPAPEGHGWPLRVCRCSDVGSGQNSGNSSGPTLPVFFVVCTKFKSMPNMPVITELSLSEDVVNRKDCAEIQEQVQSLQQAALVTWQLRTKLHVHDVDKNEQDLNIQLHRPGEDTPRYTIAIIDKPPNLKPSAYRFAAFVVPQGRETEYMFATIEGHRQLLKTACAERLAIISLHRGHKYETGLDGVKEELASCIVHLAPPNMPPNTQIPFLSIGEDAGQRDVIYEGHSDYSGDFVIEDVEVSGGQRVRRLVFLGSQGVVQSEALLRQPGRRNKGNKNNKKLIVDTTYLSCEHHRLMSLSLALLSNPQALVIGLGGGGLCTFLHQCYPNGVVTAVDIDPEMIQIAVEYFGLIQGERLKINIGDGLKFISEAKKSGKKFDAVLFDVDNKDTSLGMSCPPKEFVEEEVLKAVKAILSDKGMFVLNLVCRDPALRQDTLNVIQSLFSSVLLVPLDGEVNEVIFCSCQQEVNIQDWIKQSAVAANKAAKRANIKGDLVDVADLIKNVNVISDGLK